MKVHVTPSDIEAGRPDSIYLCPLALALRRMFETDRVAVFYDHGRVDERFFYWSEEVRRYLRDEAGGKTIEPFTFDLEDQ